MMFVSTLSQTLRQGDILDKVFFVPPSFHQLRDGQISLQHTFSLRQAYLVIISNCCDLQWYEDKQGNLHPKRPYVLVAPLSLSIPFSKDSDEYEKLVHNGENRPDNDPIQYFYFQHNPVIGAESVVDFSTVMPIRSATLRDITSPKLLELQVKHRHLFRTRLHEYFSRIPEEEWEEIRALFPSDFD